MSEGGYVPALIVRNRLKDHSGLDPINGGEVFGKASDAFTFCRVEGRNAMPGAGQRDGP